MDRLDPMSAGQLIVLLTVSALRHLDITAIEVVDGWKVQVRSGDPGVIDGVSA